MSILILNRLPHDICPYEEWLKETGEELLMLSSDEYSDQFPKNRYSYFESFSNYADNGCVEWKAIQLYEKYRYHTIIAIAERDIYRASLLRQKFGLAGQSYQSATEYRDKVVMKRIVKQNGVLTPSFRRLTSNLSLIEFSMEHGFPLIVKPVDSAGSVGTILIKNKDDLTKLLAKGIPSNWEVESFVEGEMYHVDGLVYQGKLVFVTASKYATSCLDFQAGGFTGSYLIDQESKLAKRLMKEVEKVINALDTPLHTTFHAEFFHTPADEIVLCEIASRTGGGRINLMLERSFGFNITRASIFAQLGFPLQLPKRVQQLNPKVFTGHALLPPRKGTYIATDTTKMPEWIVEFRLLAKSGQQYHSPTSSVDHICSLLVEGRSEQEVEERINEGMKWFYRSTTWK